MAPMCEKSSKGVRRLSSKRLIIYCAGGQGCEVLKVARAIKNRWSDFLFVDDGSTSEYVNGVQVLCFQDYLKQVERGDEFIIATGEPVLRRRIAERLQRHNCSFATVCHPAIDPSPWNHLAPGVFLAEGVLLSDNITIGMNACVNANATIGHDVFLEAYTVVSPGTIISGHVTIGEGAYIGTGSVIRDEVTIGKNCIIGMGSLVTKSIPDNMVAYGVPCKVVRENLDGMVFR